MLLNQKKSTWGTWIVFATICNMALGFTSIVNNRDHRMGCSKLFGTVPILDKWVLLPSGRISGTIYNPTINTDMYDGETISTSPLLDPGMAAESVVVETQTGSKYLLLNAARLDNVNDREQENGSGAKALMQQVKDAGIAGAISYAAWELGFWTLSVPVCLVAYRSLFGHWPDINNQDDLSLLGTEAFAFVNVARFAVPLRIGLALSTTPWIQQNVVDRFSKR